MPAAHALDLDEARLQLGEAFLRFWDQSELIDRLFREGKPTKAAEELLAIMQRTIEQLGQQIEVLTELAGHGKD